MSDYNIHENVAVDLVKYCRSNTIRNEQQFLLTTFAYASGLFDNTHDYVSSVLIGTSSSGKTHLKDKVDAIFSECRVMDASTGTDKALIYEDAWDPADIISMGELQQPGEEMLEFMKRAHGGDEEVVIRVTRGNPSDGFSTETIRKPAKSYHFTYAQFDADFEFWNRLLKIPVHESESKNRAVGRMQAGHTNIQIGDDGVEYGYELPDGTRAIQEHIGRVRSDAPKRVILPTGDEHGWDCWEIMKPIFNHGRSEVNRVYQMVFNITKASTLLNYHNRTETTVAVEDGGDVSHERALVAAPQDVANVVRCLRALRATTHEIDRKKRAIVEAIRAKSGGDNAVEGVQPILEFLKEADAPVVKQEELENILNDLADNFLIDIQEGAGEGGKDVYRAYKWDKLGIPKITENAELFEDCVDPMTGNPFLDEWDEVAENLETTAQDMLESAEIETGSGLSSGTESGSSQTGKNPRANRTNARRSGSSKESLGAFGAGDTSEQTVQVDGWVREVLDRIAPVIDNSRIENMGDVPVESFLGLTSLSQPDKTEVDTSGTLLDPENDIWDQPDKPNDWVDTETQARRQIHDAIDTCIDAGCIRFDTIHEQENGSPVDATLLVDTSVLEE